MKKQFLETGEVVAVHGVHGEVRIYPWCDGPQFLTNFKTFYLDAAGSQPLTAERVRAHGNVAVAKFAGYDMPEQARRLIGRTLYLDRADVPMQEGEHFIQDLIGLEVFDADTGARYGTLCDVSPTGANDVYHIRFDDGSEKLIPAIREVVRQVDLDAGRMEIHVLKGLFD